MIKYHSCTCVYCGFVKAIKLKTGMKIRFKCPRCEGMNKIITWINKTSLEVSSLKLKPFLWLLNREMPVITISE